MPKRDEKYDRRCGKGKTKSSLFFRNLDHQVKTMFKSVCVRRNDSMQDVVEALMRLYITSPSSIEKELKATKRNRSKDFVLGART